MRGNPLQICLIRNLYKRTSEIARFPASFLVLIDATTKGLSDSVRAPEYERPE